MTLCMCPICGEEIGVLDSVVMTDEGWSHKRCGRVTLADVGAAFVEPLPAHEGLVKAIAEFLYGRIDGCEGGSPEDLRKNAEDKARNLAQVLVLDFDIKPRGRK